MSGTCSPRSGTHRATEEQQVLVASEKGGNPIEATMVQDQGHDPGEHFPQVRHHPHFGEVTFVEFGAMLMQSMPQLSADEDFSRTVSTE